MKINYMKIKRGEVYLAGLDPTLGAEIKKTRPVVIVSNDVSNEFSSTITVVPLTSQQTAKVYPFEVLISSAHGLAKNSKAKADQVRTIDKQRISRKLTMLPKKLMLELDQALRIHLQL